MTEHEHDTQRLEPTIVINPSDPAQPPQPPLPRNPSFIPPLWSLMLMLLFVFGIVGGVVVLVYALGNSTAPPPAKPQVVVLTAPPEPTRTPQPAIVGTIAPRSDDDSRAIPNFALEGPTLPPVFLSPTPDIISIGRQVAVINVGENGLNVRAAPGIENALVFTAAEESVLEILAGPESTRNDGFTWWRVRDLFSGQEGWAVQLYMEVQPEGAS
jgi:hypothetical protein